MALRDEIEAKYKDHFGLVLPDLQPDAATSENRTGNGLSYLAHYLMLLNDRGEITVDVLVNARLSIVDCLARRSPPGEWLLHRSPTHQDQNAWDDYTSIFSVLPLVDPTGSLARAFLATGKRIRFPMTWLKVGQVGKFKIEIPIIWIRWYFNNEQYLPGRIKEGATAFHHPDGRFNVSAWLGRFGYPEAQCYLAAYQMPPVLTRIRWAINIALASRKSVLGQPGSWRMAYLMVRGYELSGVRSWLMNRARALFWRAYEKLEHPGDTQTAYYCEGHPIRTYWTRGIPKPIL